MTEIEYVPKVFTIKFIAFFLKKKKIMHSHIPKSKAVHAKWKWVVSLKRNKKFSIYKKKKKKFFLRNKINFSKEIYLLKYFSKHML